VIHSTAVIHPDAQLGDAVSVGPYAVIEGAARIGDRCEIQAHAIIGASVEMGPDNRVGYGAVIGGDPQDFAFRSSISSGVQIGSRNRIGEYATIHRGTSEGTFTVVGNDCFLMGGVHLAHNVSIGDHVIIANNSLLGGYVQVEERVFIGGGCVFHQFIRIGKMTICQGASAFSKDIPPYVTAAERNGVAGLNVIGLRRAGMTAAQRAEIKAAFDLLYREGYNVSQALAVAQDRLWSPEVDDFWDFIAAAKKRGLSDFLGKRGANMSFERYEGEVS
jgi:UDP-N-acetylglucosamine acyltransferase